MGGFSASNLWRMKAFFEAYNGLEKLAPLVREIAWSHNLAIMNKCKDPLQREFYIRMTRRFGWSRQAGRQRDRERCGTSSRRIGMWPNEHIHHNITQKLAKLSI